MVVEKYFESTSRISRIIIYFLFLIFSEHINGKIVNKDIPRVILLGISGIRAQDTVYLLPLLDELKREGSFYNNLENKNNQMHMPAFQAAISGHFYPNMDLNKNLKSPSIFQHVMKKYSSESRSKFWIVGSFSIEQMLYRKEGYGKYRPIVIPVKPEEIEKNRVAEIYPSLGKFLTPERKLFFEKYIMGDSWPHWDSFSEIYTNIIEDVLKNKTPYMLLGVTGEAETAHYDSWGKYVIALHDQANRVRKIVEFLKSSSFYKGNTYFMLFVDHSRDRYYMDHNEDSLSNRSVSWLYVKGPMVPKGKIFNRKIDHRDIFATLAKIYKVRVKNGGRILQEILSDNEDGF